MKKIILAVVSLLVCITLVGCGNQNANISANINNKMNKLESTINSIRYATMEDIAFYQQAVNQNQIKPAGIFNQNPYYSNINSYGNYYGGMYGMYPYAGYGYMPYYPYGYNNAFANPGFNNIGLGNIGNNNYNPMVRNITNGIFPSNIDTYRINSVTKNGKTTTTINTYKEGKQVNSYTEESDAPISNTRLQNLSSVCNSCLASSNFTTQLKSDILANIKNVRESANSIKNNGIKLSKEQKHAITEYLDSISRSVSKINTSKGEYNKELANVKKSKIRYTLAPSNLSAKYLKLMGCIDNRNAQMQSVLNTLIGLDNCINNKTQTSYYWNTTTNTQNNQSCPNGNCTNCPDCTNCNDCTNCENCINCKNCEDCKDCENCVNCKGLTGAKNCIGNNCQNQTETTENNANASNTQPNTNTPNTDTQNTEQNTNSNNQSTTNNQDISSDNINTPTAPSTAEIPVTDNKTSNNTIDVNNQTNLQQTTHSDDVIRDNFLQKDTSNESTPVRHTPKKVFPDSEKIITNGDAENPEFLNENQDKRFLHNKYENKNLARQETRLEKIKEGREKIANNHQSMTTNNTNTNQPEQPQPKSTFKVDNVRNHTQQTTHKDNRNIVEKTIDKVTDKAENVIQNINHKAQTATQTNSILNENPYKNNKGLTA